MGHPFLLISRQICVAGLRRGLRSRASGVGAPALPAGRGAHASVALARTTRTPQGHRDSPAPRQGACESPPLAAGCGRDRTPASREHRGRQTAPSTQPAASAEDWGSGSRAPHTRQGDATGWEARPSKLYVSCSFNAQFMNIFSFKQLNVTVTEKKFLEWGLSFTILILKWF